MASSWRSLQCSAHVGAGRAGGGGGKEQTDYNSSMHPDNTDISARHAKSEQAHCD